MKNKILHTISVVATVLAFAPSLANSAEDPAVKGQQIANEWDSRDQGYGDYQSYMKMTLENRNGQKSTREMRQKSFEIADPDVGDKSLTIFDKPRDIKGTAFLSFAKILESDDQWLFLPALKRTKRISSKNKSGPFLGSEFSYEDLSAQELKKYTYTWLRDEACGDLECYVLELKPTYKNSGYTRMETSYDKVDYQQRKVDYYDRKGKLLKTLTYSDYRLHLDKFWRAYDMKMVNHQTGKKTQLLFDKIEFQTGLTEDDFNKNSLKRAR